MAEQAAPSVRNKWLAAIPLIAFVALAVIFYIRLQSGEDRSTIPSALIGKQAPVFELEPLQGLKIGGEPVPGFSNQVFKNQVTVVNVWASWCVPCRQEHPVITEIGKRQDVQLVGINYKDNTENALRFLGTLGNPFQRVGIDPRGKAAIDWGVYGIPETFLVGSDGTILYKHVGPMDAKTYTEKFLPQIEKAQLTN